MNIDNLGEIVEIYFDITRDFDLQGRLFFEYTDKHSLENGIQVLFEKRSRGVSYVPFKRQGYPIALKIKDNV